MVTRAYDVSVNAIAEILRVLYVGAAADGTPYDGDQAWIRASMLERMLQTPSSGMSHVETVDDAGRWGIEVSPVRQVAFSDEGFFNACQNRLAWDKDRPSQPYGEPYPQPQEPRVMPGGKVELKRVLFPIDELNGIACLVAQTSETRYVLAADTNRFRETSGRIMDLFPPETPLAALAPPNEAAPVQADQTTRTHWTPPRIRSASDFARAEAPAIAQGNLWAPRFGGTKLSYWDHNGSGMAWEQRDEFLWIWYFRPRAGLESAGVRPGSLLFFGTQEGGSRGLARRFSKRCEDTIYEVTKTSRITHTNVFEGPYRKRNSNCSQGASRKDRLVFDYLGTSPDRITATPDGTAPGGPMRLRGIKNSLNMRAGPAQKAPKVAVLPASLKGFTLISCRPMMAPGHWQNGNARQKQALLAERWCSLNYQGQIGYVAGKFLTPE